MAGAAQAAGDPVFPNDGSRNDLLRGPNLLAHILFSRRSASSFFIRARLRRLFRGLRRAAFWCWGVGDDVEIVSDGLHSGSSFC